MNGGLRMREHLRPANEIRKAFICVTAYNIPHDFEPDSGGQAPAMTQLKVCCAKSD